MFHPFLEGYYQICPQFIKYGLNLRKILKIVNFRLTNYKKYYNLKRLFKFKKHTVKKWFIN